MNTRPELDCPTCQGEGSVWTVTGSAYHPGLGNWIPDEHPMPCELCRSTGFIWLEQQEEHAHEYA